MARFRSDAGSSAPALFLALCLVAMPAAPAELTGALTFESWSHLEHNIQDDTTSLEDAEIRHGTDTFIRAGRAVRVQLPGRVNQLTLSDGVHITYRGAVLDADSALVVFRDQKLQSARVVGSQATFSHQPAGSSRRVQGRANVIEFDGASDRVKLSGKTSYSDGQFECNLEELLYNLADTRVSTPAQDAMDRCTVDLDAERVPTPRTPERSTAQ